MKRDIAYVSFAGGSALFPARTPYDRQIRIEHVLDRARARGVVQVLLNDRRWMVTPHADIPLSTCALCERRTQFLCAAPEQNETAHLLCVRCALDATADSLCTQAVAG
jgi:hypothetical protein